MAHCVHNPVSLLLIGGGGHGLVVAEAARAGGVTKLSVLDDQAEPCVCRLMVGDRGGGGVERVGGLMDGLKGAWIVTLGDMRARRRIIDEYGSVSGSDGESGGGGGASSVVHPTAIVSPSAEVGAGVFVGAGAIVHSFASIGSHAIINTGAIVEHECVVGCNAHIAPGAVLGGNVCVGDDTLVGLGSRVLPGVSIGSGVVIGAGAVVTGDVASGLTVKGCPARP